jgi:centrosomal protein CEP120
LFEQELQSKIAEVSR